MFNFGGLEKMDYPSTMSQTGALAKPRTLREQLQDKLSYHASEIQKIQEAMDSLSPEVERALNALSRI